MTRLIDHYEALVRLMDAAGYLSVAEVEHTFGLEHDIAWRLLRIYYRNHPDHARREQSRLRNKALGGWF